MGPSGSATPSATLPARYSSAVPFLVSALARSRIVSLSIAIIIAILLLILGIPGSFAS